MVFVLLSAPYMSCYHIMVKQTRLYTNVYDIRVPCKLVKIMPNEISYLPTICKSAQRTVSHRMRVNHKMAS